MCICVCVHRCKHKLRGLRHGESSKTRLTFSFKYFPTILFSQLQAVKITELRGLDDVEPPTASFRKHISYSASELLPDIKMAESIAVYALAAFHNSQIFGPSSREETNTIFFRHISPSKL